MKFTAAVLATVLLASTALAVPAAEPQPKKKGLLRAGNFGNWCIAPGQMCYKTKRDLYEAAEDVTDGFYALHPDQIEKRNAEPEPKKRKGLLRAGNFGNWCIAPGQMCYKTKRDLYEAAIDVTDGYYALHPDQIEKRNAEPQPKKKKPLLRAGNFGNWCIAPGQMCYKTKRDVDTAIGHVLAGYEAPAPADIEKREAAPEPKLVRAGNFGNWCIAPGQMCYKSKRDLDETKSYLAGGDWAPLPQEFA